MALGHDCQAAPRADGVTEAFEVVGALELAGLIAVLAGGRVRVRADERPEDAVAVCPPRLDALVDGVGPAGIRGERSLESHLGVPPDLVVFMKLPPMKSRGCPAVILSVDSASRASTAWLRGATE